MINNAAFLSLILPGLGQLAQNRYKGASDMLTIFTLYSIGYYTTHISPAVFIVAFILHILCVVDAAQYETFDEEDERKMKEKLLRYNTIQMQKEKIKARITKEEKEEDKKRKKYSNESIMLSRYK